MRARRPPAPPAAGTAFYGNPADRKLACSQSGKVTIQTIVRIGLLLFLIIQQNTILLGEDLVCGMVPAVC